MAPQLISPVVKRVRDAGTLRSFGRWRVTRHNNRTFGGATVMATKRGGGRSYVTGLAAGLFLAGIGTGHPQTIASSLPTDTAHVIEWDLTSVPDTLDGNPGAMVVDKRGEDRNRVWFVTRLGDLAGATDPADVTTPQRIYRFDPATSLYKSTARWSSWELRGDVLGGGIRIRP